MTRTAFSFLAAVVLAATLAAPVALANGRVAGRSFTLAMTDFPDECVGSVYVHGTILIRLDPSVTERQNATIQTWVETPFGRAYLSQASRSIAPGRTVRIPVTLAINTNRPLAFEPFTATLGVSVTLKNETLELSHDIRIAAE